MRVAVISSTVFAVPPPGYSGLEQLAWQQAKGLAAKGHEVTLIAPEGSHCEGCRIVPTGPPGTWDEHSAFAGRHYKVRGRNEKGEEVEQDRFQPPYWPELLQQDCIIDNSWTKEAYCLKAEGALKCPVLGVMHAPVHTMYQSLPPGVEKPCFVCISQDQANHFNALHSPAEARVCYNGIDLDFYKPMEGVKRTDRFLFLARFSTIKGPDLAIEACRKAGVGLDLVGDMSITNEPEFMERCKSLCDGKQIRMVGPAARGECVWWFSQAHCLLHPNQRYREPFGLAPVEAMACGCPVIAWDYGAMRETIKSGETGFLVKSMDELATAVGAIAGRNLTGGFSLPDGTRGRCREWASQFSIQRMINRYDELIHEAVDGGGW